MPLRIDALVFDGEQAIICSFGSVDLSYTATMSKALTIKAPAKINLTLRVGPKRADGFHEIRSVMQAVSLFDILTLSRSDNDSDSLQITGPESSKLGADNNNHADNLVLRALRKLRERRPDLPYCRIELEKVIPVGAGLGGGSSDCASVLQGANQLFELDISQDELIEVGAKLGSDVPFFFSSGSALVSGRGERLERLNPPLDYSLILINPGIHISTAEAFTELDNYGESSAGPNHANAGNTPLTSNGIDYSFSGSSGAMSWWRSLEEEGNDFERLYLSGRCKAKSINGFAEILRKIQDRFRQSRASLIRMSGSGSTVFGVFGNDIAPEIDWDRSDFMARRGWRRFSCRPISLPDMSAKVD